MNGKLIKGAKISVEESKPLRNRVTGQAASQVFGSSQFAITSGLSDLTVANYKALNAVKSVYTGEAELLK